MMFAIDYKLCGFITCEFIEVDETRKTDKKHKQLKLIAFHKCMFIDFIFSANHFVSCGFPHKMKR